VVTRLVLAPLMLGLVVTPLPMLDAVDFMKLLLGVVVALLLEGLTPRAGDRGGNGCVSTRSERLLLKTKVMLW
jgi:hypothetical protein